MKLLLLLLAGRVTDRACHCTPSTARRTHIRSDTKPAVELLDQLLQFDPVRHPEPHTNSHQPA